MLKFATKNDREYRNLMNNFYSIIKFFFVKVGPNHLFGVNWDIESRVRLCSVRLLVKKCGGLLWWFWGWGFRLPLTVEEVGQVVLALLPTRLQGLVGSMTLFLFQLCLPSTSVVILEFWDFGIFEFLEFFLSEEENGRLFSAWQKWQSYN